MNPIYERMLKPHEIETIETLAECDMNIQRTADKLFVVRGAVIYRLNAIHKKTGLNPQNFYDLSKLIFGNDLITKQYERMLDFFENVTYEMNEFCEKERYNK